MICSCLPRLCVTRDAGGGCVGCTGSGHGDRCPAPGETCRRCGLQAARSDVGRSGTRCVRCWLDSGESTYIMTKLGNGICSSTEREKKCLVKATHVVVVASEAHGLEVAFMCERHREMFAEAYDDPPNKEHAQGCPLRPETTPKGDR